MVKVKLVHVKIIDGTENEIAELTKFLKNSKVADDYQFVVTNEQIEFSDIRQLIDSLYELYKKAETFRKEREGKQIPSKIKR